MVNKCNSNNITTMVRATTMSMHSHRSRKSQAHWRKLAWTKRRRRTMRSCLRTVLRCWRWRRRKRGRRSRRRSARPSRSCKSDKGMRRIGSARISLGSYERLRRRTDWWGINKKEIIGEKRLHNKIKWNKWSNWMMRILSRSKAKKTRWWFGGRRRRRWWRTRRSRKWYASRRWTQMIGRSR